MLDILINILLICGIIVASFVAICLLVLFIFIIVETIKMFIEEIKLKNKNTR